MRMLQPCVLGFLVGVLSLSAALVPNGNADDLPAVSEEQAEAIARINTILNDAGKLDVIECPLTDLLAHVEKTYKLKISVDIVGLKRAGVTQEQLVTSRSEAVPLRKCLHKALDPLRLSILVRPDGLLITSPAAKEPVPK